MATFKIHEDAEKENPPMQHPLREKLTSMAPNVGDQRKLLAVSGVGGAPTGIAAGKGGGGGIDRPNFATLNNPKNVTCGPMRPKSVFPGSSGIVIMQPKMAFREVSNVKPNDNNNIRKPTVTAEQIKAFTVYEDRIVEQRRELQQVQLQNHLALQQLQRNQLAQQQLQRNQLAQQQQQLQLAQQQQKQQQQHQISCTVTSNIEIDKENVILQQQQQQQQKNAEAENKSSMDRDISVNSGDYTIDGTPMSITDVLSPMSVDRSNLEKSMIDDSNDASSVIKKTAKNYAIDLPRNDRQRFFEVVDYQRDILEYFRESEQNHRPKTQYMARQTDINHTMRTILVDWLVEVSEEYNLDTETLYLAVAYIDRFLSHMSVVRSKLQLVGTAAMYIAAKYEEIYPPDVSEFVFITDDTYTKSQVLRMEQIILKILTFDLCTPTCYAYLNTYAVMMDMPNEIKMLALYLSELSLLEADPFLRFVPSQISSASVALARYNTDMIIWTPELQDITSYKIEDLKEVILELSKLYNRVDQMVGTQAMTEKYKADKYMNISALPPSELKEDQFNEIVAEYYKSFNDAENAANNPSTASSSQNVRKMISLMFN